MTQGSYQSFRIGSGVLVALAVVHAIGHFSNQNPKYVNGTEDQLNMLMSTYLFNMMGTMRSTRDLMDGLSLSFSLFSLGLGAVGFVAPVQFRISLVYAVLFAAMTALSLVYWFVVPTVFLAVATSLFAAAAYADRPVPEAPKAKRGR